MTDLATRALSDGLAARAVRDLRAHKPELSGVAAAHAAARSALAQLRLLAGWDCAERLRNLADELAGERA